MPCRKIALPRWVTEFSDDSRESVVIGWEGTTRPATIILFGPADNKGTYQTLVLRQESATEPTSLTVCETLSAAVLSTRFKTVRALKSKKPYLDAEVAEPVEATGRDPEAVLNDLLARRRLATPAVDWVDECRVLGVMSEDDAIYLTQRLWVDPHNAYVVKTEVEEVIPI